MAALKVVETQFQTFIKSRIYLDDEYVVMTSNYFLQYTQLAILEFRDTLIQHMESVKKSIDERAHHKRKYDSRVNERHMQTIEEKVDTSKALDDSLVRNRKSVLQPHRNQSVVRQPTGFKSKRPRISKPRFASQVDVNNDLSKPVTTHYLPKKRESVVVKPHHVIASSESRNSSKNMPRFSLNYMVHNHYLEEAKKKTQRSGRNSRPSVMPSARSQSTANGSKPKPRSNDQNSRNWPLKAGSKSCSSSRQDSYITTRVGITIPPSHNNAEVNILFKHVVSVFPELAIDHYLSHDRVMHPFAPHYERNTQSNHGKKRPHESNSSSSFTTLNHPSSSRLLDDTIDVNDEESFHFNSSSPSQNVSSSSNVVLRVRQNPPHESHDLNAYLSETINLQTQQRDAHREGLRSIGKALKDMMSGKQK
nr:hypothetical protein [Tanacetum cinerariifolium]